MEHAVLGAGAIGGLVGTLFLLIPYWCRRRVVSQALIDTVATMHRS
jgi:hypothetical protein